jgi:hypothetical protein
MGLPHKNLPFNSRQLATLEIEQLSPKELECKATLTVAFCIYPAAHRWADCWLVGALTSFAGHIYR